MKKLKPFIISIIILFSSFNLAHAANMIEGAHAFLAIILALWLFPLLFFMGWARTKSRELTLGFWGYTLLWLLAVITIGSCAIN